MRFLFKTITPIFFFYLGWLTLVSTPQPNCDDFGCWNGIAPGQTTIEEAKFILERRYPKQNVSFFTDGIVWSQLFSPQITGYSPTISHNTVKSIRVYLPYPKPTLEHIIANAGEPTFVSLNGLPECDIVYIYFSDQKLLIWFYAPANVNSIQPNQRIDAMMLTSVESRVENALEWQGYINYCDLIDVS